MKKSFVKALKSYRAGYIKVNVKADAGHIGTSVAAAVSIDVDLDAAKILLTELHDAIQKEEEKAKARAAADERRAKWREREIASGRIRIISLTR